MARLRLFGIGVPAFIGLIAGIVAQTYWVQVQLFLHGGSFGVDGPPVRHGPRLLCIRSAVLPVGADLSCSSRPSSRSSQTCWATTCSVVFGWRGATGALSRSARIQLVVLVGTLILLKAVAYWLDRYELLSHTRGGKPFTGAGYTDINAVLPAKLILLAIALICAAAVFSAVVLRDLRIPAIGVVLLLLSSLIVGAALAAGRRADQRQAQRGAEGTRIHRAQYRPPPGRPTASDRQTVTYRNYRGDAPTTAQQVAADRATTSNIRLLDPTIVSPAFTQFQQGKNFYYFPDQLSIDRYNGADGNLRDLRRRRKGTQPRSADRQPARLDQPAQRVHPRQRLHRLAREHRARNRQRPQPERRLSRVPGQRGRRQRQCRVAGSGAAGSAAHLLRPGHRRYGRGLRDRRRERHRLASTTTRPTPRRRTTPTRAAAAFRWATGSPAACSRPSSPSGTSCSPT